MSANPSSAVGWPELVRSVADALRFRPLVCWTVALLAGIAWADWAQPPLAALVVMALLATTGALASCRPAAGVARAFALALAFLVGGALHVYRTTPRAGDIVHLGETKLERAQSIVTQPWGGYPAPPTALVRLSAQGYTGLVLLRFPRLREEHYPRIGDRFELSGVALHPLAGSGARPGATDRRVVRQGVFTRGEAAGIISRGHETGVSNFLRDRAAFFGDRVLDALTRAMPGSNAQAYADLLGSMVYGQQAVPLGADLKGLFRRSGTIHLLVVSGAQVSLLALGLLMLLRGRRRALPLWAVPPVVVGLVLFGFLAGLGVSITRAIGMHVLLLVSFALGRRYDFATSLALAALCLCLGDTGALFEPGSQLTYACTVGVYLTAVPAERRPGGGGMVRMALLGTLGAWLFSVPVTSCHLGNVVLLGMLANVVAVPLSGLILFLGLLAIGLGLVWAPLATPACLVAREVLDVLLASNRLFARLPWAVLEGTSMSPGVAYLWYVAVALLLVAWRTRRLPPAVAPSHRPWAVVAVTLVAGGLLIGLAAARPARPTLELHVMDVGAGQCLLIRGPTGAHAMVDAGTEVAGSDPARFARRQVVPYLALHGVNKLEALVISHSHADHCNLAPTLLASLPVCQLLVGPHADPDPAWQDLLRTAQRLSVPLVSAHAGGRLDLGGGAVLDILGPNGLLHGTSDDANNNNLVLRLSYGQTSVLLPCDLQAEGEQKLMADLAAHPEALRSTVLIGGHHGSRHSSTEEFVRAVAPQVVLLSSGRGYQAPRPEGLEVFARQGLEVWQTGERGNLLLRSDGRRVSVQTSP